MVIGDVTSQNIANDRPWAIVTFMAMFFINMLYFCALDKRVKSKKTRVKNGWIYAWALMYKINTTLCKKCHGKKHE